jgi:hypothetical protein
MTNPEPRTCRHCGVTIYQRGRRWFDGFGSSRCANYPRNHQP